MYLLILMLHMKHSVILQNLHPTMYLLILIAAIILLMALLHLHPTMYLLILLRAKIHGQSVLLFTSHYVSINSLLPPAIPSSRR